MKHILTFKGCEPPVDRFSSFVSTEATSRDVHEDDDVTFLAAHVGKPVNAPLAIDLLAAWTDVSETFFQSSENCNLRLCYSLCCAKMLLPECKIDSYLDIALG